MSSFYSLLTTPFLESAGFTPFQWAAEKVKSPALFSLLCLQITWEILLNVDSDSVGLEQDWRFCFSNKLPGDTDSAGL